MRFIEHIIEPTKLLMIWQSEDDGHRTRYIVAELLRVDEKITLRYLIHTKDFHKAYEKGFKYYPAFQAMEEIHLNILDIFMYRLPPRNREDFSQYLTGFRIRTDAKLSDFALLGYTGAKLPSDGFSFLNPFENINEPFEFLLEACGFRHIIEESKREEIKIGDKAYFEKEFDSDRQEDAIKIFVNKKHIGYVTRGLVPNFKTWVETGRIAGAWVEKVNGMPTRPAVYLYIKVLPPSA